MEDKEYVLVHEDGIIKLENRINEFFQKGYYPDGDVVISHNGDKFNSGIPFFIQRMKKKPTFDDHGYGT